MGRKAWLALAPWLPTVLGRLLRAADTGVRPIHHRAFKMCSIATQLACYHSETRLRSGLVYCHAKRQTQHTDRRGHGNWSALRQGTGARGRGARRRRRGAGQIVEVVLCIVRLVTGLEKLPLAEVLTRHKRHGHALGIYLVEVVACTKVWLVAQAGRYLRRTSHIVRLENVSCACRSCRPQKARYVVLTD